MSRPTKLLYRLYEDRLQASLDPEHFPRHIAIILDGHRRYARSFNMSSYTEAYRAGMRRFEDVVGWAEELDIPAVTAWVLSRENLDRPAEELDPYFDVLVELFGRLPALGRRYGLNVSKRSRLIRAGSDIVIPDFSQYQELLTLLFNV